MIFRPARPSSSVPEFGERRGNNYCRVPGRRCFLEGNKGTREQQIVLKCVPLCFIYGEEVRCEIEAENPRLLHLGIFKFPVKLFLVPSTFTCILMSPVFSVLCKNGRGGS